MPRQRQFEFSRAIYCTGKRSAKLLSRQRQLNIPQPCSVVADATQMFLSTYRAINCTAKLIESLRDQELQYF